MPKFKRKPDTRIFEAEQFRRSTTSLINSTKGVCQCSQGDGRGHVHTIHAGQIVDLEDGDWVMPESDGRHFYPIKPDIFEATYEPADEPAAASAGRGEHGDSSAQSGVSS